MVSVRITFIVCKDKKEIKIRPIASMLILQLVLGFLLMNTQIGITIVSYIAKAFTNLMGMTLVFFYKNLLIVPCFDTILSYT
ncbi:Na+ dependent nucleoside transporter N-terminal domain-containing protein [Cytobacillus purgationiresistens]|uniref:Na+ dependent nucleoside transporter N-terminal domain-containing protein n=1 Tax=Cytobacillus purgationiresistens TaxID=863449 RepID=UPI0027D857D3|nr:Na+ dependent nucleoside transporter N-terminal domain-containing protein [Cytobacillus purgationiresistens]